MMLDFSRIEQGHEDLELWYHVKIDEWSTPQLPRIICMQTPVTEEKQKAIEARIARSIYETFLMRKKKDCYYQKWIISSECLQWEIVLIKEIKTLKTV